MPESLESVGDGGAGRLGSAFAATFGIGVLGFAAGYSMRGDEVAAGGGSDYRAAGEAEALGAGQGTLMSLGHGLFPSWPALEADGFK